MLGSVSQLPVRAAGLRLKAAVMKGRARSLPFSGLDLHCATLYQPSKKNAVVLM